MKRIWWAPLLTLACACGTAPHSAPVPSRPDWISGQPRSEENGEVRFVGVGEDRTAANARQKAEALALQDVANECSFVPRGTRVDPLGADDEIGVIHRSYARVWVPALACQAARATTAAPAMRTLADPVLQGQVERYQSEYDPPELSETPGGDSSALDPFSRYYALRQQAALANQSVILGAGKPNAALTRAPLDFAQAHVEVSTVPHAFSERRPNVTAHLPSAVRDTVAERKRIEAEYPATPLPKTRPPSKGQGRGRGRRHMPVPAPSPGPTG